ncbi:cation/acetate symporter ActP [Dasania marina]|uniref:cation/acetate symporter ActP n=1 Tax=Dasania marina TaxID=471499 RepID=UPI0003752726|nr:cation/acetate symporter ActP [Dasania marina]
MNNVRFIILLILVFVPIIGFSSGMDIDVERRPLDIVAISIFIAFVAITLGISFWASKHTTSSSQFYTAGGNISAAQNGTAIAGDFMSAASFLGISGLIYTAGFDGLILAIGALSGWPIMLFLMSERVRNLGKFTFTDVVSYRLQKKPIRLVATLGSISVIIFYLIAQMVGAGKLIELLFGLPYELAVSIVGLLVVVYVTVGGMLATTWVQIVKALLLLFGVTVMSVLILINLDFDINALFYKAAAVHTRGDLILQPGSLFSDPIQAITIAVSMMFGVLGLPHILMRLFTVSDMEAAKKSVFYSSGFMGYFYLITILIGFSSIIFVSTNMDYFENGKLIGGSNMAAIHLSHAVGGNLLMGFMSAVAFATILAVVAGLTVAGSAAVAHDLYAEILCKGEPSPRNELLISRITACVLCAIAVLLGILFQNQNVAFIAVMPMVISASVNFPILILAMYWRRLSTRGAVIGGLVGFVSSIGLIIAGPKVWVDIIGADRALFPYDYPALFTMSAAFITIWLVSLMDRSDGAKLDRSAFDKQLIAAELATDVSAAVNH